MTQPLFLLATYVSRAKYPHMTARKGYWSNPDNVQTDEQVAFAHKVRDKDLTNCNVILDMTNKKVLKCVVGELTGSDYDRMYDYFKRNYPNYIEQAEAFLAGVQPDKIADAPVTEGEAPVEAVADPVVESVMPVTKAHDHVPHLHSIFPTLRTPQAKPAAKTRRRRHQSK